MASVIIKYIDGFKSGLVEIREIQENQPLMIGRDPSCDILLDTDDDSVIDFHCSISYDGHAYNFQKIDSRTRINGNRISNVIHLKSGDEISVGKNQTSFRFDCIPAVLERPEHETYRNKRGLFRRVLKRD